MQERKEKQGKVVGAAEISKAGNQVWAVREEQRNERDLLCVQGGKCVILCEDLKLPLQTDRGRERQSRTSSKIIFVCMSLCCFAAQSNEGQGECVCVEEGEAEGGYQLGAAKCRVTGGASEAEKDILLVPKSSGGVNWSFDAVTL